MKNYYKNDCIEVGLDEVGRGCMLGRVYTACVIWPIDYIEDPNFIIKDSKKLSKQEREYNYIINTCIEWNVNYIENTEIDKINILNATMKSMHENINNMYIDVDHILVDGTIFYKYKDKKHTCVIKGDNEYYSIAAASIIAKVEHDWYIENLCKNIIDLNIKYDLLNNMGYGTKKHIEGIKKNGITEYHRKSFGLCKNYS